MSRKDKGRTPGGDATRKTTDTPDDAGLAGWFNLAKSGRANRQQKRGLQRGRK